MEGFSFVQLFCETGLVARNANALNIHRSTIGISSFFFHRLSVSQRMIVHLAAFSHLSAFVITSVPPPSPPLQFPLPPPLSRNCRLPRVFIIAYWTVKSFRLASCLQPQPNHLHHRYQHSYQHHCYEHSSTAAPRRLDVNRLFYSGVAFVLRHVIIPTH